MNRCPWCDHPIDCSPGIPGKSHHHGLCCVDQERPACALPAEGVLRRIMREDAEERWSA